MVRSKPASKSKKPNRGGVDFKKLKRKIGRKLPPPRNATNTQIKSKAIVLPEQSVATERGGMAVNKKGLTLRELLHQTSHHNAKIRRVSLNGIRDLILKCPMELKLHKLAVVEKLRERICDNDKVVRETLYHLLKTVVLPGLNEDINAPIVSLVMAYVFNAMTHLSIDIRLMAFKFFELIVLSSPSSFFTYADKVLDNYIDIFRSNQIYLQEKKRFKTALSGLKHCLSLLVNEEKEDASFLDENPVDQRCLHAFEDYQKAESGVSSVIDKLEDLLPALISCFQESSLPLRSLHESDAMSSDCTFSTLHIINLAVKVYVNEIRKMKSMSTVNDSINRILLILKRLWEAFPMDALDHQAEKGNDIYVNLNVRIAEIFLYLSELVGDALMVEKFLGFLEHLFLRQAGALSNGFLEKQLSVLVPYVPGLVSKVPMDWKIRLLEAFSAAFRGCRVESKLTLVYLSAIEKLLLPIRDVTATSLGKSQLDFSTYPITWMHELPKFLLQLGEKHPSISKLILNLLLRIGQCLPLSSDFRFEYDQLQWPLKEFYCIQTSPGSKLYGPFIKLPSDCQEVAICCLYYFSALNPDMLESLAYCCLCGSVDARVVLRIIEVLHSAYRAGHVKISDHIAFLITLVVRCRVLAENAEQIDGHSNRAIFRAITHDVCSCLSQIGDSLLVFKFIYRHVAAEFLDLPLDNMRGLLIIIFSLCTKCSELLEESQNVSFWISHYLLLAANCIPEAIPLSGCSENVRLFQYFAQPCLVFFCQNKKFLSYVLKTLDSRISEYMISVGSHDDTNSTMEVLSRLLGIVAILSSMYNDVKLHPNLSSSEAIIRNTLGTIMKLLLSCDFSLEDRHRLEKAFDELKARVCQLHQWRESDLISLNQTSL